jgi:hypothetical protein
LKSIIFKVFKKNKEKKQIFIFVEKRKDFQIMLFFAFYSVLLKKLSWRYQISLLCRAFLCFFDEKAKKTLFT